MAAEQQRPDVAAERQAFREAQRLGLAPDRLVFLDETWVKTNMTRGSGWGPTGQRVIEAVPHGHGLTTTFVAGPRSTGLVAPLVADGAINGAVLRAYGEQQLVRVLRPGDGVVMDNLASHEVAGVREAIAAAGATVVFLPPYRPDLNPIENVLAKAKNEMRKRQPRTKAACDDLCGEVADGFPPDEGRNDSRHAGYVPQDGN